MALTLKPQQDGAGYFYGEYVTEGGVRHRIDILPPKTHARPSHVMENDAADETRWILYVDGAEVARAEHHKGVGDAVHRHFAPKSA